MLITIAIPTYNNEKTIAKAIGSALNQDYIEDYEILVVNNASKDGTQKIIESFKDRKIRQVVNKETVDMYSNHNICLKEAKGDYVLFCHSDDELQTNALSILSKKIKDREFPQKYILWGHSVFRDFYPSILKGNEQVNTMFSGEAAVRSFLNGGLTPSGTCYSRLSLLELGGFPISTVKAPEMDWVILLVAAFNFFEFEMFDRIIFKRVDASTAVSGMSQDELIETHRDTFKVLFSIITESQKKYFIEQILPNCTLDKLISLKEYVPRNLYKKLYLKKRILSFLGDPVDGIVL